MPGLATAARDRGRSSGSLTTGALYVVSDARPRTASDGRALAVGYNALVVLVKFVLSPRGLYEVSEEGELRGVRRPEHAGGATLVGASVFVLYALALVRHLPRLPAAPRSAPTSWKRVL